MTTTKELAQYEGGQEFSLPEPNETRSLLLAIRAFQAACKDQMVRGADYGVIPGTQKPTLLKPGAEKVIRLLGLADEYDVLQDEKDWVRGFFHFQVRCRLIHLKSGKVVSNGLGECNSMESKYRWRWVWERELPPNFSKEGAIFRSTRTGGKQYRMENEDIYSQVNTLLKMAKKRAMVDAALSAGRLSEIFTQDMEDLAQEQPEQPESPVSHAPLAKTPPTAAVSKDGPTETAITFEQLKAEVEASGMTWGAFEIQVLRTSWAEFSKAKGANVAVARARWETWKEKQPKET